MRRKIPFVNFSYSDWYFCHALCLKSLWTSNFVCLKCLGGYVMLWIYNRRSMATWVVWKLQVGTLKCIKRNQRCDDDLWMYWTHLFIYNITLSSLYFGDVYGYVLYLGWTIDWNFLSGYLCTHLFTLNFLLCALLLFSFELHPTLDNVLIARSYNHYVYTRKHMLRYFPDLAYIQYQIINLITSQPNYFEQLFQTFLTSPYCELLCHQIWSLMLHS